MAPTLGKEAEIDPSLGQIKATKFVDLLTSHQRELYAYINTLVAGDASASDVLQDTNLDLWSRIEDYDFSRPFLPWAFGFAFQRVMAFRKSQYRSRLVFSDEMVSIISEAYVAESTESDGRLTALQSCLEKLEPPERQLVRDRYQSRVSVKMIAARSGSTANQVSAKLYRIRRALAKCVEINSIAQGRS